MRTLIYKRTHCGDPNPQVGVFGNHDCMGTVRGRQFDAVIGIGGIRPWPECKGIAGKVTWVGIGAHQILDHREIGEVCRIDALKPLRGPLVTFDDFWYRGGLGPLLEETYPALASRMYDNKYVRAIIHSPSPVVGTEVSKISDLDRDVEKILEVAKAESRSGQLAHRDFQNTHSKYRSNSCRGR